MHTSKRSLFAAGAGTAAALAIAIPLMTPSEATTTTTDTTQLTAELSGANEVPPADPNGTGIAFVFGAPSSPNTLCYVVFVDRIATPVAAHIHRADAGVNGPVVVPLKTPTDGHSARCTTTTRAANILANPQNFYVNVHNAQFPDGAVRGQLG